MQFELNEKLNKFLKYIVKNAQTQNIRVFFVGGIVRDKLLNIQTKDIDLIINSNAIDFAKSLDDKIKIKSIHKDFATVKVQFEDLEIDIASTRTEHYPYSGCLPEIDKIGVEIELDVKRRDFSVNSLYCELKLVNDNLNFKLIDLVNGVEDIKNKKLRVLHDKSYIDDPTRIIRGLGFKYRFNFDFCDHDKKLTSEYLNSINYKNASYDRIFSVFKKTLKNEYSRLIFDEIIKKKYYKILKPDEINFNKKNFERTMSEFLNINYDEFFIDIIKNENTEPRICTDIVDIYKKFSKFNKEELAYYFYKTQDKNALLYNKIKDIKLFIKGSDLIELGYKEGAEIGSVLDRLLKEKLTHPESYKTKADEVNWVCMKAKK